MKSSRARSAPTTSESSGSTAFIRSCLEIPIIGGPGPLVYGVWVTLMSQTSDDEYVDHRSELRRFLDDTYFGWSRQRCRCGPIPFN